MTAEQLTDAAKLSARGKNPFQSFFDGVHFAYTIQHTDEFLSSQYSSLKDQYFELKVKYEKLKAKHAELKKYDKDLREKYFDLSSRLIIDNTTERW